MSRFLLIFTLALTIPAAARAQEGEPEPIGVKTGARGTIGTGGYLGRGAFLQYGQNWLVRANYSDYRFDGSTGTTRTAGLRASYQGDNLSVGVMASVTPRNDFYANRAFGVDGGWTFVLDDSDEPSFFEEFELGAWWGQTRHSQVVPATRTLPIVRDVIVNQHDFGVSASLTAFDATLSVDAYRSIYDQDFDDVPAAARRRPRLAQTAALVNGFPERGGSARLDYSRWRAFSPFVSIAATRYKIQPQPATATAAAGASFRFRGFAGDLGYELVRQKGTADTKYLTFGASFKF